MDRLQLPLVLAYALTVHKCQTLTLDAVILDSKFIFKVGQISVALSRVRSPDHILILNFSHLKCLRPSSIVLAALQQPFGTLFSNLSSCWNCQHIPAQELNDAGMFETLPDREESICDDDIDYDEDVIHLMKELSQEHFEKLTLDQSLPISVTGAEILSTLYEGHDMILTQLMKIVKCVIAWCVQYEAAVNTYLQYVEHRGSDVGNNL